MANRGSFSVIERCFERLLGEVQNIITRQIRERKGLKIEETTGQIFALITPLSPSGSGSKK